MRRLSRSTAILLSISMIFFVIITDYCSGKAQEQDEKYSWYDKIMDAKHLLKPIELKYSLKTATYKETTKIASKNRKKKTKVIIRKRKDFVWKEAALAVMEIPTGKIEIVKIKKDNQKLINLDERFIVEIEPRVNGLTWNGRNTAFKVSTAFKTADPSSWVVIANKWLDMVDGKPREIIYVPYSTGIHQEELSGLGYSHLGRDVAMAFMDLDNLGVRSLVRPDEKIRKVSEVVPGYYPEYIVWAELTDPQEFYAYKSHTLEFNHSDILEFNPFERVAVILGANGGAAFQTFNYAGAVGLTQFTNNKAKNHPGTWDMIRATYSSAKLPEFKIGAVNHIQSIKAAILLYDYNLNELVRAFGPKILDDKNINAYLYAAHNCGIGRVIKAIKLTKPGNNWRVSLRKLSKTDETIIYLEKLDYLAS